MNMNNSNVVFYIYLEVKIGKNVMIGFFVYIDRDVEIGDGIWIGFFVIIFEGVWIGKNCRIFLGVVIVGILQDLKFKGEKIIVEIGDNIIVREYVMINWGIFYVNIIKVG